MKNQAAKKMSEEKVVQFNWSNNKKVVLTQRQIHENLAELYERKAFLEKMISSDEKTFTSDNQINVTSAFTFRWFDDKERTWPIYDEESLKEFNNIKKKAMKDLLKFTNSKIKELLKHIE